VKASFNIHDPGKPAMLIYLVGFIFFGLPSLIGYGAIPLANFTAEALCVTGLALMLALAGLEASRNRKAPRELAVAIGAFALLAAAAVAQFFGLRQVQPDVSLVLLAYLFCAGLAVWVGWAVASGNYAEQWFAAAALGLVVAGVLAAFASIAQYFEVDARILLISPVSEAGRTFGFIRQPNHQGTFLNLGLIGLLVLQLRGAIKGWLWIVLSAILVFGIATTGSRTAILQIAFVSLSAAWFCRRNWRGMVRALWPLFLIALVWLALFLVSKSGGAEFYGAQKLGQTTSEGIGMRSAAWHETINMIAHHPLVGWGSMRYPAAFFLEGAGITVGVGMSHSHNLPLQLAVDFGLPLAIIFLSMLAFVVWRVRKRFATPHGFFAFVYLGCLLIHSFFEFPLWYAYFLLPTCWVLGSLTGNPAAQAADGVPDPTEHKSRYGFTVRATAACLIGALTLGVAMSMNRDYYSLTPVYAPGLASTQPERFRDAERVFWFRRFADFPKLQIEAVTPANADAYLRRAATIGCVMSEAWFQTGTVLALAQMGRVDEAKWILYIIHRMSNGKTEYYKKGVAASTLPAAAQLAAYLENPVPVPKATRTFEQTCYPPSMIN